jgi:5'(3')-deoxyribonucleotidase
MRPVLAIDFDDVLFPFMDQFVPHYNSTYDANFELDDYHTFEFHEVWGGDAKRAFDCVRTFFHQPHVGIAPIEGATKAIEQLSGVFDLVIVTARDETLRRNTQEWVDDVFPGRFRQLFLCNSYVLNPAERRHTKVEVVENIDAVALVDDSLHNATQVGATGRRAMLFGKYPWNRTDELPQGVTRCTNWTEIVESLVTAA